MMPVSFAAFGKGSAVRLVSGGIEQFAGRSVAGDAIALEISDMGAQRARRTHLAHDPRLDHGAAAARLQHSRRGKARGAAAPKPAATAARAARKTAGLLRGLERLRQERFCSRPARRADSAWTDAKIVVSAHRWLAGCQKLSADNALSKSASCAEILAMFRTRLNLALFLTQPTVRTLRLLSCPPRSLVSRAQFPSCRLPRTRSGIRQDALFGHRDNSSDD